MRSTGAPAACGRAIPTQPLPPAGTTSFRPSSSYLPAAEASRHPPHYGRRRRRRDAAGAAHTVSLLSSAAASLLLLCVLLWGGFHHPPAAQASNADNYFCRACATLFEESWHASEPIVAKLRANLAAGHAKNVTVDLKGRVVQKICDQGRFRPTDRLAYTDRIRDGCAKIVEQNDWVVAEGLSGKEFPDLADLYPRTYWACVEKMDLCDPVPLKAHAFDPVLFEDKLPGTSKLDECERCKAVVADIIGVLSRSKGSPKYRTREHVWSVLEDECVHIVSRFPKHVGLRLQSTCENLLEDYEDELVGFFAGQDGDPFEAICGDPGKLGTRMCRRGVENRPFTKFVRSPYHKDSTHTFEL